MKTILNTFLVFFCILAIADCKFKSVSYGFAGINSQQFESIFHKFPIPSLLKLLDNMENQTDIIIRPFNFGATQDYAKHTGVGKSTNVKGKSCYLPDEILDGKITYIQSNQYTGRNQTENKITYMGKNLKKDNLTVAAFRAAASQNCKAWATKPINKIKDDIIAKLKQINCDSDLEDVILYIKQRFLFKVNIQGKQYLTTQYVTTTPVKSSLQVPVTKQVCENGKCHYEVSDKKTNIIDVLAYDSFNLNTCNFKPFELVADMDILTIHFPHKDTTAKPVDLKKYFNDPTGKNCQDSFKLGFGISPELTMVYNYVYKLMQATAQWGLIRHSIEALNFCFTQPYEKGQKYYLKISKNIISNGEITMIKESADTRFIPDLVRMWVLEGKCTPLNPSWLFVNQKEPKALMWDGEEKDSILKSSQFLDSNCPTYDVIKMIKKDGGSIPIASLKKQNLRTDHQHKQLRHRLQ